MVRRGVQCAGWLLLGGSLVLWVLSTAGPSGGALPGGWMVTLDWGGVFVRRAGTPGAGAPQYVVPLWGTLVLGAVLLWGQWRFGWERRQAALVGHCPRCAYDLTGIGDDELCPECGRVTW